jgi:predicted nucleic acid-binding protein
VTDWLLDTNILAELRRSRPEPKVLRFIAAQPLDRLFISTVSFAEIRFGIERMPNPMRRVDLLDWLTHRVRPMFDGRVLPISEDVMLKWRLMVEEGRRVGHTFSQPDLIIAATASVHGMTVVTRDITGFAPARVSVLNPWADSEPISR